MKRIPIPCLVVIVILLAAGAVMAWMFLLAGRTATVAGDGRRAIVLDPPERALVLGEMSGFLGALQKIADAAARNDAAGIAAAARPMGMAAASHVPVTLAAKLPLEFRQLGRSVHQDFDRIALDAETLGDVRHSLAQVSEALGKCGACHATFQIALPAAGGR